MGNLFSKLMAFCNYDKRTEDIREQIEDLIKKEKEQEKYVYTTYGYGYSTEPIQIR